MNPLKDMNYCSNCGMSYSGPFGHICREEYEHIDLLKMHMEKASLPDIFHKESTFIEQTLKEFTEKFPLLYADAWNEDYQPEMSKKVLRFLSEKLEEAEHRISNEIGSNVHAASVKARKEERTRIIELVGNLMPILYHKDTFQHHKNIGAYLVLQDLLTFLKEESGDNLESKK